MLEKKGVCVRLYVKHCGIREITLKMRETSSQVNCFLIAQYFVGN